MEAAAASGTRTAPAPRGAAAGLWVVGVFGASCPFLMRTFPGYCANLPSTAVVPTPQRGGEGVAQEAAQLVIPRAWLGEELRPAAA